VIRLAILVLTLATPSRTFSRFVVSSRPTASISASPARAARSASFSIPRICVRLSVPITASLASRALSPSTTWVAVAWPRRKTADGTAADTAGNAPPPEGGNRFGQPMAIANSNDADLFQIVGR
jgi:hypothetical protein